MRVIKELILFLSLATSLHLYGQDTTLVPLTPETRQSYIDRANVSRNEQHFTTTLQYLDTILLYDPLDGPILLYKGDVLLQDGQFKNAARTYEQLMPLGFERTIAMVNYSYALFMDHAPKKALKYAEKAYNENSSSTLTMINYFNALLWNEKTGRAAKFYNSIEGKLDAAAKIILLARLSTTRGNYKKGLDHYASLCDDHPNSDHLKEYLGVLISQERIVKVKDIIESSASVLSEMDRTDLLSECQRRSPHQAEYKAEYFNDVASNKRIDNGFSWQQGRDNKFTFGLSTERSKLSQTEIGNASILGITVRSEQKWTNSLTGKTEGSIKRAKFSNDDNFSVLLGKHLMQYKPHDHFMIAAYAENGLLDNTVELMNNEVRSRTMGYSTNIMPTNRLGVYSEGDITYLSDDNRRSLAFASIYRIFRTEPTVKAGINASYLTFSNTSSKLYFSPERFINSEIFLEYMSPNYQNAPLYCKGHASLGVQKIEENEKQQGYRLETEIGSHRNKFHWSLKYQTSNVASNTVQGYRFSEFTFALKYQW